MILDGKKVFETLAQYEKDLLEEHQLIVLKAKNDDQTVITAAQIRAVREIMDRLSVQEIKA